MKSIDNKIPEHLDEIIKKIDDAIEIRDELTQESTTAGYVRLNRIIAQLGFINKIIVELENAKTNKEHELNKNGQST